MMFLNAAEFARPKGSKDRKPRIKKAGLLKKSVWNADVVSGAANGGTLGLIGSTIAGGSTRKNIVGAATGLTLGTGLAIRSKYKKLKRNYK